MISAADVACKLNLIPSAVSKSAVMDRTDSLGQQIENDVFDFRWVKREPGEAIIALEGQMSIFHQRPPPLAGVDRESGEIINVCIGREVTPIPVARSSKPAI